MLKITINLEPVALSRPRVNTNNRGRYLPKHCQNYLDELRLLLRAAFRQQPCGVKKARAERSEKRKARKERMAAMWIQYDYYHVQQKTATPKKTAKPKKPRVKKPTLEVTPPAITTPPVKNNFDEGLTPAQIAQRERLKKQLLLRRLQREFGADALFESY